MKKSISYIFFGIVIAAILSLILTIVLELSKLLDAAGVFFFIFLVLACIFIGITIIIGIILLYKNIKKDGFVITVKPILLNFFMYSIVFLILNRVFGKGWFIGRSLFLGILFSLISLVTDNIKKK